MRNCAVKKWLREDANYGTGNGRVGGSNAGTVGWQCGNCDVMVSVAGCQRILGGERKVEEIAEHFGVGFLHLVSGVAMIAIFRQFLVSGGIIYEIVQQYLGGICG